MLRPTGTDRVRLTIALLIRPLHDQFHDKDDSIVDNQRADRIGRYDVSASLDSEVCGMAPLEGAHRGAVNARPLSVGATSFALQPDKAKAMLAAPAPPPWRRAEEDRVRPRSSIPTLGGAASTCLLVGRVRPRAALARRTWNERRPPPSAPAPLDADAADAGRTGGDDQHAGAAATVGAALGEGGVRGSCAALTQTAHRQIDAQPDLG